MKKSLLILSSYMLMCLCTLAQPAAPVQVTDKQPVALNGLEMGYIIKSTEVKTVGSKGDFSRYSVKFYVTNTTPEAKIILYKQGWNVLGNVSDQLAVFNCLNATGARFTTKTATINATSCNVLALVDDVDPKTNKTVQNKRLVQIGYWIKAGQTISTDAILITPLNEMPNMQVTYMASSLQPSASVSSGTQGDMGQGRMSPPPPSPPNLNGWLKIKNASNNTFINDQLGPPQSTSIDNGWWSAQWMLMAIPGSNVFNIKNRWKSTYLDMDRGNVVLSGNLNNRTAMWTMETTQDPGIVLFKNAQNGQYLCIATTGNLILSNNPANNFGMGWVLQ